jgi:menaquinone-dependent protoporphyrinogen IX oxidase
MRVLIAFGSRYGSTEEIAHRLAGFLGEEEVEATVLDVKRERRWPSLEGYDGVIVGSGVKITKWMREPLEFLRRKRDELEGKRLALFVSCLTVLTDPEVAHRDLLEKVAEEVGVEAELMEAFGPVMDVGPGSRMGFLDKRIAKTVMAGLSKDKGMEFDTEGRNDLRDWDRIREFAHRFAERLQ